MDGVNVSKGDVLAAMLETRINITASATKSLGDAKSLKDAVMATVECYEESLRDLLQLGVK